MIPTTIATVASALQIIDYIIRFSRSLAKDEVLVLEMARQELIVMDPNGNRQIAERVLQGALTQHISSSETAFVSDHISILARMVGHVITEINRAHKTMTLPRYENSLQSIWAELVIFAQHWGCFETMGIVHDEVHRDIFPSTTVRQLPAPGLTTLHSPRCYLPFYQTMYTFHSDFSRRRIFIASPLHRSRLEVAFVENRHPYSFSIAEFNFSQPMPLFMIRYDNKPRQQRMDTSHLEKMVGGSIQDYLYYASEVRKRMQTSRDFLDRLSSG